MKLMNMKVFKFAIIGKPILFSKMDRSKYNLSKGSHQVTVTWSTINLPLGLKNGLRNPTWYC